MYENRNADVKISAEEFEANTTKWAWGGGRSFAGWKAKNSEKRSGGLLMQRLSQVTANSGMAVRNTWISDSVSGRGRIDDKRSTAG